MEPRKDTIAVGELLEHAGWVRTLAQRLVQDSASADDLAQDAWVAAVERRPDRQGPLRPWLGRVVRNLASTRSLREKRRARREDEAGRASAARESSTRGTAAAELVERAELQRLLVNEVMALDDPLRSTLLWRFFEGLTAAEIGRRTGVPPATVRGRIKDGLERLRERLDRKYGGDRALWCAALVPLATVGAGSLRTASGWIGLQGVLWMQTSTKIVIAGLVLVAAMVAMFLSLGGGGGEGTSPPGETSVARVVPSETEVPESDTAVVSSSPVSTEPDSVVPVRDEPVAADTPVADPVEPAVVEDECFVAVAVLDHLGDPVDAQVYLVDADVSDRDLDIVRPIPKSQGRRVRVDEDASDSEGATRATTYRVGPVPPGDYRAVAVRQSGPRRIAGDPLDLRVGDAAEVELVFPEGIVLYGRVFEEDGSGRPEGHISAYSSGAGVQVSSKTDARGYYEMGGVSPGRYQMMSANLPDSGREPRPIVRNITVPRDVARLEVNLGDEPKGETTILGRVIQHGEPAAGRLVELRYRETHRDGMQHQRNTISDERGEFTFQGAFAGSAYFNVATPATRTKRGSAPEFFVVTIPNVAEHRVDLVYPDHAVTGTILGANGAPPSSGKVYLRVGPSSDVAGDPMLGGKTYTAELAADGSFAIAEVKVGSYVLIASAVDAATQERSVATLTDIQVDAVGHDIGTLRLARDVVDVVVRVAGPDGTPINGAKLQLVGDGVELPPLTAFTKEDGRARLASAVMPGSYAVEVSARGYAARRLDDVMVRVSDEPHEIKVDLTRGGGIELAVMADSGRAFDSAFVALTNPDGVPLPDPGGSRFYTASRHGRAMTDIDGQYMWDNIHPGEYRVTASSVTGASATGSVTVVDGQIASLELELPKVR